MSTHDKHTFALYSQKLGEVGKHLELVDQDLWHRITHVLRLTAGEQVILFDGAREVTLQLSEKMFSGKNKISGTVLDTKVSEPLKPAITLMPSLLKREAFETVAYLAAQMGATTIQPLLATKTQRAWNSEKEYARLTSIMVAACEQAKNFVIPELKKPIALTQVQKIEDSSCGIYFEDDGAPLLTVAHHLETTKPQSITLVFGPEGGLTSTERRHLGAQGFICYALTPTILRAQEAVAVGLGAIRSIVK